MQKCIPSSRSTSRVLLCATSKNGSNLPVEWFPLVRIALLGYGILHAKIALSMTKVTVEFNPKALTLH